MHNILWASYQFPSVTTKHNLSNWTYLLDKEKWYGPRLLGSGFYLGSLRGRIEIGVIGS